MSVPKTFTEIDAARGTGGDVRYPASTPTETRKVCRAGTHRVLSPEDTLKRIEPIFPVFGITRLADVTWLDEIGIPVYQAVRPNSWTLSVSQGKGLTPALAKVSAAMESIEAWHAERVGPGGRVATVAEMEAECGYRVQELVLERRHCLHPSMELEWTNAVRLSDGAVSFVPTQFVRLDGRISDSWTVPLFDLSSNGLASGNTFEEAVLHGLFEIVERDALVCAQATPVQQMLATDSVDGSAGELLVQLAAAGVDVRVEALPSPTGMPCFRALIWSEAFPVVFGGVGCHLDRDVALCRALTEAAQSRVTEIAGTRDDISAGGYRRARDAAAGRVARHDFTSYESDSVRWMKQDDIETISNEDLADDLRITVDRLLTYTGRSPLVVDHTRPDLGVPVVRVICPRLRFDAAIA